MLKKIILSLLWALGFLIGTGVLIGVVLGTYVALTPSTTLRATAELYVTIGYIQMAMGGIGLVLAVLGLLPGTKSTRHDDAKRDQARVR